jgi:DNA-binding winged helix-turn-helix (wHTH) protein
MRLSFGAFVFDSRLRAVTRDGTLVGLSPKAVRLLEALIEARPAPVAKEALYERLWPRTFVETGNLHNLVAEIRRALDDYDRTIIRTEHGFGYAFAMQATMADASSRYLFCFREEVVPLHAGENIIGRDPASAVLIDSPDVSRQHARLYVSHDHVLIEDLGSKNGTFIGDERVSSPRLISDGDEVLIGKTLARLRRRGDDVSTVTERKE